IWSGGYVALWSVGGDGSLVNIKGDSFTGEPASLAFSPDDTNIAVGFENTVRVTMLSGADLSFQFSPSTSGISGELSHVVWSQDGAYLYAGGKHPRIVRWDRSGRGKKIELTSGPISSLAALNIGGIAFGSIDPSLGVLSAEGRKAWYHSPPTIRDKTFLLA